MDDVMEVVRKGGGEQELTEHLNSIAPQAALSSHNIMKKRAITPCHTSLDTLITRKGYGSVKLLVYRQKTHTHINI